jgi:phosphoribosylformylglycinamidine cyclo-ligase
MCVNDVVTVGARPLFFLDYFGTGKLDLGVGEAVIRGVAEGCKQAGCALLGGETAELPGHVRKRRIRPRGLRGGRRRARKDPRRQTRTRVGDVVLGVASSGLHSNGYSLARHVFFERMGLGVGDVVPELGVTVGAALLVPTRIYAKAALSLVAALGDELHALSHITGGGLPGNLPRVLPEGLGAHIRWSSNDWPAIFRVLQAGGPVEEAEMRRTFNLGVGLVAVVAKDAAERALATLGAAGERAWVLGEMPSSAVSAV